MKKENTIWKTAAVVLMGFMSLSALAQSSPAAFLTAESLDSVHRMVEVASSAEDALSSILVVPDSVNREERYTFTVATYNVDGLPPKISCVKVNMDGPQSEGTTQIAEKLLQEDWDIIGLNEDFNYHKELEAVLSDRYGFGTWRGEVSVARAFRHGLRIPSDGLGLLYKKTISVADEEWVKWCVYFGYWNHGSDGLACKGFRHYTATMPFGMQLDVFVLHADAGEALGDAWARKKQFRQLAHYIISANTRRPKVVMGDFNCFYDRDELKDYFIDSLSAAPHLTIKDACIEPLNNGVFPECSHTLGEDTLTRAEGEKLDHIVYINDDRSEWQLQALYYERVRTFLHPDGKPLSDHEPIVSTMRAIRRKEK